MKIIRFDRLIEKERNYFMFNISRGCSVGVSIKGSSVSEVEVSIVLNDFYECESREDKELFIKNEVYKELKNLYNIDAKGKDKSRIEEIEIDLDEFLDILDDDGGMFPNESYEEFMEHEDFDK